MAGKKYRKPNDTKAVLKRLFGYISSYKFRLVIVFVCMIAGAYCEVQATYYLKPAINDIIIPLIGKSNPNLDTFIRIIMLMATFYLISVVCNFVQNNIMVKMSNNVMLEIRADLFDRMSRMPLSYFDTHGNGTIMSHYTNDVDALGNMLRQGLSKIVNGVVTCVSIMVIIFVVNWRLAIIVTACTGVLVFVLKKIVGGNAKHFTNQQQSLSDINTYAEEMISGKKEIETFGKEQKVENIFNKISDKLFYSASRADFFSESIFSITTGLTYVGYTLVLIAGCLLTIAGSADVGTVGVFINYYKKMMSPLTGISKQISNVFSALAGAERIFSFMDEKTEVDEGEIILTPEDVRGQIEFKNVVFAYNEKKDILKDFSLKVDPGQKIAFVGTTGAGKTTVVNLLSRLYEIKSGEILLDGTDIRDIDKDSLRNTVGMVLQETHLFTGSVADNIRYGRPEASDEDVRAAARLANADIFIERLKNGYDTILTHDGADLSQGERQLLSIARTAIGKFPILVLDEATSSIDTRTESLIDRGLNDLMKGRTVFVIAHRLSTVRNADVIVVLDHGRIMETGTHSELLSIKGMYYKLYTENWEMTDL